MKKQKRAWKNFEITKVKLNPEQAVLTCCDTGASSRGQVQGSFQCIIECAGNIGSSALST